MELFVINLNYIKDDITIGHIEICSNSEDFTYRIWILNLFVTDSYRHNGIGSKLVNYPRAKDSWACKSPS